MQSKTARAILSSFPLSMPLKVVVIHSESGRPTILELTTVTHILTKMLSNPIDDNELITVAGISEINIQRVVSVSPRHGGPKIEEHVEIQAWDTSRS